MEIEVKSKFDIFKLDPKSLPEGQIHFKTNDGWVQTNKQSLENTHKLVKDFEDAKNKSK